MLSARFASVLTLALVTSAVGQTQPNKTSPGTTSPDKTPPASTGPEEVLSGPKVKETQAERSLIRRNFQGRVQRLDSSPAEAAVDLLSLDAETKAKVKAILDTRTSTLDRIVRENLELLLKFQNTPDRRGKLTLLREAKETFKPLEQKGTLQDQIIKVLPKDQADRYRELIQGYWDTLIADAEQEARNGKDKAGRVEIQAREVLLAFGTEIRRSYERQIASKTKALEEFLGKLGLSAEKEAKLRTLFAEFAERTKGKPTEQQRRDFFLKIMRELDKDQQKKALEEVLGRSKPEATQDTAPMMDEPAEPTDPKPPEPMKDADPK